jgi:hypothetical protein
MAGEEMVFREQAEYLSCVTVVLLSILLQGCATGDYGDFIAAYEEDYRSRVSYRTHLVPRDGFRIHAREYGEKNEKPTLVMMHGFPDSELFLLEGAGHFVQIDRPAAVTALLRDFPVTGQSAGDRHAAD